MKAHTGMLKAFLSRCNWYLLGSAQQHQSYCLQRYRSGGLKKSLAFSSAPGAFLLWAACNTASPLALQSNTNLTAFCTN